MEVSREEFDARLTAKRAELDNTAERLEVLEAFLEELLRMLITQPPANPVRQLLQALAEGKADHDPVRDMAIRLLGQ